MKQFRFFSYIRIGEYMKIEIADKKNIFIFINSGYLNDTDLASKEDIIFAVKDFIIKYKKRLNLRGFYKVKVFVNKKVGLFLDINRLEDIELSNTVDLRVIVYMDEKIYFETENYYILPDRVDKYYYNNRFYCDASLVPNILNIVEFGSFIYGDMVLDILDNATVV